MIQGFYFSPPVSRSKLLELLLPKTDAAKNCLAYKRRENRGMCRKIPEITKFQEFFCFLLTERLKETWAKGLVKTLPHTGTGPKNKNSTEDMLKKR